VQTRSTFQEVVAGFANRGGLIPLASQIFIVTMVLMAAALILMSLTLSSLKVGRAQGEAAEDTLLEITTVDSRLIDSDFALTGHALNPDPWFVARIASVRADTGTAMNKLRHSVGEDHELVAQYKVIAARLKERQALYDYLTRPENHREVANVTLSTAAQSERNLTDEVRGRLWGLLGTERAKRLDRFNRMIAEAERSYWIAVGVVMLAMVSGAINLLLMHAAAAGKKRA
jgi:hypothetical protein